jgi:hypothetical protein
MDKILKIENDDPYMCGHHIMNACKHPDSKMAWPDWFCTKKTGIPAGCPLEDAAESLEECNENLINDIYRMNKLEKI